LATVMQVPLLQGLPLAAPLVTLMWPRRLAHGLIRVRPAPVG